MIEIFGYQIEPTLFWAIVGAVLTAIGVIVALVRRARLRKEDEEHLRRIEDQVKKTNEGMQRLEKKVGIEPIYIDGLSLADRPVFDPFLEGTKLMIEYKWNEAISEFEKAMKEAKGRQLVGLYNLVAICYYTSGGRLSLVLENYEESLRLARQFKDKEGEVAALGNIGIVYYLKDDLKLAFKYLEEALKINRQLGRKEGEAIQLGNIGLVYQAQGNLDQVSKYFADALKTDEEIGSKQGKTTQLGNIGLIYKAKDDPEQALRYFQEALKIDKEIGFRGGEAGHLDNIGLIYSARGRSASGGQAKGDLDEALKYLQEALEIDRQTGHKPSEAIRLNNIGTIYRKSGDLHRASKYYNEALEIFQEIGMPREIEKVKRNVERISQQIKQMEK